MKSGRGVRETDKLREQKESRGKRGKEREHIRAVRADPLFEIQSQKRRRAEHREVTGSLISHPLSPATKTRQVENETA